MGLRRRVIVGVWVASLVAGCTSVGPRALQETRLAYNEVVKSTTEQQLLLNIVRLRYTDTPSSLSVANIAAQFELVKSLQLTPFFVASGVEPSRTFSTVLPGAGVLSADRPTISLVPIDDQEFTRRLFTPITLDGIVYLAKTTWPISTVFRLYLENLNWVPNAELASGPTPRVAPPFGEFLTGILALQELQSRSQVVFGVEERQERVGGPLQASQVTAAAMLEAAKSGLDLRRDDSGSTWGFFRKVKQPVMYVDPAALRSAEMREFTRVFRLKPDVAKFDVTTETLPPFVSRDVETVTNLDLETRSLLQALYFVAQGVRVPPDHLKSGVARTTLDRTGEPFDWSRVTEGLFEVRYAAPDAPPASAHVAVFYQGYWFYIDAADHDSKSTFSLLVELSRLELQPRPGSEPVFTLPLGGR